VRGYKFIRSCKSEVAYIDTNILIRYFTKDVPEQSEQARGLMLKLKSGEVTATIAEIVLGEMVWVLSSKVLYHQSREEIQQHLTRFLSLKGVQMPHKRTYLRALELYAATGVSFADALCAAHMERQNIKIIWSFDPHFDRISGLERREP
jgi:predicted nucleic acid-binding protein